MNQNYITNNNDNSNRSRSKISSERSLSREKKFNSNKLREALYSDSEISQEEIKSINKDLFIKGLILVFIYFSVIIYSLLYMLTPEKDANLFFEGSLNNSFLNYSNLNNNNDFYKLDSLRIKENLTIINISRNFLYENNNDINNNLLIKLFYSNQKIINKVVVSNNNISKEFNDDKKIYHYYKLNDFPFWLVLINNDNENKFNITSNILKNFSFDI